MTIPATRVTICDVGPRDGLQNIARLVDTANKVAMINALAAAGLPRIEATSFVSPRAVPQLADAEDVMRQIVRKSGVTYAALVPNARGAERALACRIDELNLVMSASEAHNRANLRMSRARSVRELMDVAEIGKSNSVPVTLSLSCAFGCPFEGDVAFRDVIECIESFRHSAVAALNLCDTTGMAYPRQVRSMLSLLRREFPTQAISLHFHNTRGLGIANALAAAAEGFTRFDASVGGIGGCPFAPGATGNVCTEDLVHALHLEGYETGIDLNAMLALAANLPALINERTHGHIAEAGPRTRRYDLPASAAQAT